jgi:hypothetical protein
VIVPAGGSRAVTNAFYFEPTVDWSTVETTTEIEAANGKRFRHISKWTLRHKSGQDHELEDEHLEKIEP